MFPVLQYIPYIIALYVCLHFSTQALAGNEIIFDTYGLIGMISAFFVMLMMRTFDDLKDLEIDKDLFPDRATPRNAVFKSDIQILSASSIVILITINFLFAPDTLLVFSIVMIYLILTFKWFFAEEFHRKNVFFTMVTHQPIPYAVTFYLIHMAMASGAEYESFTLTHFWLLLVFSLPVTAWEVSRKIRAVGMETNYETFSMLFGSRGATMIPFVALIVTGILAMILGVEIGVGLSFYIVLSVLMLVMMFFYIRFLVYPTKKHNVLINVTMLYTTLVFINFLVHIIFVTTFKWML